MNQQEKEAMRLWLFDVACAWGSLAALVMAIAAGNVWQILASLPFFAYFGRRSARPRHLKAPT